MIRINKLIDYGVVVLLGIAKSQSDAPSARLLSQETGITLPMTKKVLKLLSANYLVESVIGSKGGYRLRRSLKNISIKDVMSALSNDCLEQSKCGQLGTLHQCDQFNCNKAGHWSEVEKSVNQILATYKLDQLNHCYYKEGFL
ncbi:Rrf2 family transcriptional regulator [Thiotrichales bacterium 19S11-10]|nr:Rrf2 family transcriptional regulator [Thiotrichales bacterium 19S11-10]MCF6807935.1 Rrf2 family transcriptional regulator [Thiotrichales bacterium 19S9-11]MCF6811950.1 Rrf2 family transcriptional regulator [Thiotrichales bacterium 19S9-12]